MCLTRPSNLCLTRSTLLLFRKQLLGDSERQVGARMGLSERRDAILNRNGNLNPEIRLVGTPFLPNVLLCASLVRSMRIYRLSNYLIICLSKWALSRQSCHKDKC